METKLVANRIAERKLRDKQARRAQIISAARRIAELEGWSNVTLRRLAEEISYSQPVLYAHFGSREGILAAVAIEGFQEMGLALEKARKRVKRGNLRDSDVTLTRSLEVAGWRPAGCKSSPRANLQPISGLKIWRYFRACCPNFALILPNPFELPAPPFACYGRFVIEKRIWQI